MHHVLDAVERILVVCFFVLVAVVIAVGQFPQCAVEDQTMCVWDSATHGNAQGSSFIAFTETFRIYLP
ncbi:hypothetical protein RINGS_88 [Arthrobacter phage Rings]|uniref:Uncharacterized protein n=1 Tax=Arthrobacter phage Rings TaxID=1772313 RepID=A0A0U4KQY7_9CAUD|nr:hypothetical protein RINGS_88 [Arthrobacter phage Rings]